MCYFDIPFITFLFPFITFFETLYFLARIMSFLQVKTMWIWNYSYVGKLTLLLVTIFQWTRSTQLAHNLATGILSLSYPILLAFKSSKSYLFCLHYTKNEIPNYLVALLNYVGYIETKSTAFLMQNLTKSYKILCNSQNVMYKILCNVQGECKVNVRWM